MYSIFFNNEMERHAAQAPAVRERFHHSKFVIRHSLFCGSLFNPGHRGGQSHHQKKCPQRPLRLFGKLFSISKFKFFGSKSFQVFPAKFIFAGKRFGGNDVGHHFLVQGVYDGTVQSFGNCHHHEGLI